MSPLALTQIAMNPRHAQTLAAQEILHAGSFFFIEAKDKDAIVPRGTSGWGLVLFQELEETGFFRARVDDLDFLDDACVGAEFACGVVFANGDLDGGAHKCRG